MDFRFDPEKLTARMHAFVHDLYILTAQPMILFNPEFVRIGAYPENNDDIANHCMPNPLADHLPPLHPVHTDVSEMLFPLRLGDTMLGYLYFPPCDSRDPLCSPEVAPPACQADRLNAAARLMEICVASLYESEPRPAGDDSLPARLSAYIAENLTARLTVETLCRQFTLSRNRLYRLSHDHFGMSIAAYIRTKRMEKASKLLLAGATVAEAASKVGIDDYNYFSKLYKRETGKLPSKDKRH